MVSDRSPRCQVLFSHRLLRGLSFWAATVVGLGLLALGCAPAQQERATAEARPLTVRDVPDILRGIIGSETTLRGGDSQIVSGIGIVVGLNGTGSGDVPDSVRIWLEREMTLRGVGQETFGFGAVSPDQLINDPNTAVVEVYASISPGAPMGSRFDVLVRALAGTSTTSLEGGTLWTTDLRPGAPDVSGTTALTLAQASGPVYINPFIDPATSDESGIDRRTGRILHGGVMTQPLELMLVLDNPSHLRARAITSAINTKFPRGPMDRNDIARGRDDEAVILTVPYAWKERSQEFIQLLRHTRIDTTYPEVWASRYIQTLKEQPALSLALGWSLQATGPQAIPELRKMYDYAEPIPRLTALRAGARLGDPLTAPHLKDLARSGPPHMRGDAMTLLAELPSDPGVNAALRELLDAEDPTNRIAAYEALVTRRDPAIQRRPIEGKFNLDLVASTQPMIYVAQSGEPRVAVFGSELKIERPLLVFAWSDRLILASDSPTDPVRLMYKNYRTQAVTRTTVDDRVGRFIEYLGRTDTPETPGAGIGLTYSEVVGALYELTEKQRAIPATFYGEQDRLQAELLAAAQSAIGSPRPELSEGAVPVAPIDPDPTPEPVAVEPKTEETPKADAPKPARPSYVVPIAPPPGKSGDDAKKPDDK